MNRTAAVAILVAARLAFAQASGGEDDASGALQQKIDEVVEEAVDSNELLEAFTHLRFSGYVQARYLYSEASGEGLNARGKPDVTDGFMVRRGRLKATYALDWSEYVLNIDATGQGVTLKDGEVHLIEPWTGQRLELVVGQTKYPFGFEVGQSSSVRELPERSRVVRAFLAGDRDRGAKLLVDIGVLRAMVGVFDGNGIDDAGFVGVDNDQNKDLIGRVGVDFGFISGGVSGWYGRTFRPDTVDSAGAVVTPGTTFDRTRLGMDLQLSGAVLSIGRTELRGEFIAGRTYQTNGVEQFGVPAIGWYAVVVQHLGDEDFLAVRYDYFDPLAGTKDTASADGTAPAPTNSVGTVGMVVGHEWNRSVKLSAAYEIVVTGTPQGIADPDDNVLTLQFQARF
ncbi:MAG: porin [Myxococcaceae bacterium]|nr:porin [Myxococcaceae bacterium]